MRQNHMKPAQKPLSKSPFPLEMRHVSEAIINLYAAHINSFLYPYDHPLVSDSLRNSFNCLQKVFQKRPTITLAMRDDGILADGESLGTDLPMFRHFSALMRNNQIHELSISDELTRRELINFHRIISLKRHSREELLEAMKEKGVASIAVSKEQAETLKAPGGGHDTDEGRGLIPGYVSTMLGEETPGSEMFADRNDAAVRWAFEGPGSKSGGETSELRTGAAEDAAASYPDVSMAHTDGQEDVCQRRLEALFGGSLPGDETMVLRDADPRYLAHLLNTMLFRAPDKDVVSRVAAACFGERDEMGPDAEDRCLVFLGALKPALKPAFRAFAGIADPGSGDGEGEGDAAVNVPVESLGLSAPATRTPERVLGPYSPRVIRKTPDSDFIFDFVAEGKAVLHDIELRSEWPPLFHSDHLAKLRELAETDTRMAARKTSADSKSFSAARVLESCAEEAVSDTAFSVLLELIGTDSLEEETYQALADRLSSVITFYAERGAFEKVLEVFNALKTQSLQGKRSLLAVTMLSRIYSTDRFNAIVVESLRKYGRTRREAAGMLTSALRSSLIPYLLDSLSDESDTSKRRFMISLLTASRGEVLSHILRRLGDSRWYVLRNMLFLLRECHGRSYASEIREFLSHEVPLVRLEAIRTLLSFQEPGAEQAVVKLLSSDNFQLQKAAVQLAGTYRIREALPYLVRLLREKDILGKKFLVKRSVIRTLGRIGHESVLNPLLHICRETSLIHKENYDKLRIDIFRTLHHYPVTAVRPFIDYGLKTNNREIAVLSRKLADRYIRAVERQQK